MSRPYEYAIFFCSILRTNSETFTSWRFTKIFDEKVRGEPKASAEQFPRFVVRFKLSDVVVAALASLRIIGAIILHINAAIQG